MPFCHMCGAELPQGAAFCGNCGARQESNTPTPQTAAQYAPTPQAAPAYTGAYAPAPAPAPKKKRIFLKIIIVLLVLAIAAAAALVVIKYTGIEIPGVDLSGIEIPVIDSIAGTSRKDMTDEELITDRIKKFEKAFTSGKFEKMLDCMDPAMRAATQASMDEMNAELAGAEGMPFGVDSMFGLVKFMGDFYDIIINDIQITGDRAIVYCTMNMDFMGETSSEEIEMPMIKIDGDWYLGGSDDSEGFDFFGMF